MNPGDQTRTATRTRGAGRTERAPGGTEPMFSPAEEGWDEDYTLRDLVRVLFKHWVTIVTCFAVVTVVVVAGLLMLPPTYIARGKVLVKTELQDNPSFFSGIASLTERRDGDPVNRRMETEMELIETTPLAEQVVRDLHLTYDQVYHSPLTHLTAPLVDLYLWAKYVLFGKRPDPERHGFRATVAAFQKSIQVNAIKSKTADSNSNIVLVGVRAPRPGTARQALDRLLDAYRGLETRQDEQSGQQALALVSADLARSEKQVRTEEARLRTFLGQTGFVPPATIDGTTPPAGAAPPASVPGSAGTGTLRQGETPITTPRDERTIEQLKARLVEMEVDLLEARQIYRENSQNVQSRLRAIAQLQQRIDQEVQLDAENYSKFIELDRDRRTAEARYNDLQRKQSEIALYLQVRGKQSDERIVVEAPDEPEGSDWKRRLAIGLLGSVAGLVLGVGFAGLAEYGDQTLDSKADVRRHLSLDVLAILPEASPEDLDSTLVPDAQTSEDEAPRRAKLQPIFQALASRLITMRSAGASDAADYAGRAVLVTSATAGEGKTTVAAALAVQMAQMGYGRVLLADANFERPQLHRRFIVSNAVGMGAALSEHVSVEPLVGQSATPGLRVLPAGQGSGRALLLNHSRVRAFLEVVLHEFDWVIFDGGSVEDGFISTLARLVHARILVVNSRITRVPVIRNALLELDLDPRELSGAVLNRQRRYLPDFLYRRF